MLDLKKLLEDFIEHVENMTDEELKESILHAERITKECQ